MPDIQEPLSLRKSNGPPLVLVFLINLLGQIGIYFYITIFNMNYKANRLSKQLFVSLVPNRNHTDPSKHAL